MKGKKSKSECILYKVNYLKYRHRKKAPRNSSKMQTVAVRLQVTFISLRGNFRIAILNEGNSYRRTHRTPYILKLVRVTQLSTQYHKLIALYNIFI